MSKFILQLKQRIDFEDEESCFDALVSVIDEAQEDGFKMTKIMKNRYIFTNEDGETRSAIILKGKDD